MNKAFEELIQSAWRKLSTSFWRGRDVEVKLTESFTHFHFEFRKNNLVKIKAHIDVNWLYQHWNPNIISGIDVVATHLKSIFDFISENSYNFGYQDIDQALLRGYLHDMDYGNQSSIPIIIDSGEILYKTSR